MFTVLKKGFSLLELILVLGVGTIMAFMKFQDMKNDQESILASTVGQQIKQMGEAVNGYINIRYDKLSTLSNSEGNGIDPGPRTCSGSVCEITYQTLVNEGLLPSTYTGINAKKSPYKILLKREGTSPNYVINGIITTAMAWIEGDNTRYDLLGKAMQTAGIDSGITRTTSNAFGYGGQWLETSINFNNITTAGQLVFRVGFNSALYSIYLRRDGTLPMTGNLNMGGKNIVNVEDIISNGNITAKTIRSTFDSEVGENLIVHGSSNLQGSVNIGKNLNVEGKINSKDRIIAEEYIKIGSISNSGTACPENGLISRDSSGGLLSCKLGYWTSVDSNNNLKIGATFNIYPGVSRNLGRFKLCLLTYRIDGKEMASTQLIPTDNPDNNGYMNWYASNRTQYSSYYMGIHCFI